MPCDLDIAIGAFVAFFLVEIDVDGIFPCSQFLCDLLGIIFSHKNDPNSFFHMLNMQLFHYIFKAFEYHHVEREMSFNVDLTSYL